jgi:hypothetical protein
MKKYYLQIMGSRYSLLTRIMGIYSIPSIQISFIIMDNLIPQGMDYIYDLKGSTHNRLSQ